MAQVGMGSLYYRSHPQETSLTFLTSPELPLHSGEGRNFEFPTKYQHCLMVSLAPNVLLDPLPLALQLRLGSGVGRTVGCEIPPNHLHKWS
jgi:hypothetical protein